MIGPHLAELFGKDQEVRSSWRCATGNFEVSKTHTVPSWLSFHLLPVAQDVRSQPLLQPHAGLSATMRYTMNDGHGPTL